MSDSALTDKHLEKIVASYVDEQERLLAVIADMVRQNCICNRDGDEPEMYDTSCISANAEAMEALEKHGLFRIERGLGRMLCGYFTEDDPKSKEPK